MLPMLPLDLWGFVGTPDIQMCFYAAFTSSSFSILVVPEKDVEAEVNNGVARLYMYKLLIQQKQN